MAINVQLGDDELDEMRDEYETDVGRKVLQALEALLEPLADDVVGEEEHKQAIYMLEEGSEDIIDVGVARQNSWSKTEIKIYKMFDIPFTLLECSCSILPHHFMPSAAAHCNSSLCIASGKLCIGIVERGQTSTCTHLEQY